MKIKNILLIAIGVLLGSITVYAISVKSTNVTFTPEDEEWEVSDVESALNDLYDKMGAAKPNIARYERPSQILLPSDQHVLLLVNLYAKVISKHGAKWAGLYIGTQSGVYDIFQQLFLRGNDTNEGQVYSDSLSFDLSEYSGQTIYISTGSYDAGSAYFTVISW